jgi:hypothetical protein
MGKEDKKEPKAKGDKDKEAPQAPPPAPPPHGLPTYDDGTYRY